MEDDITKATNGGSTKLKFANVTKYVLEKSEVMFCNFSVGGTRGTGSYTCH
jgi:hypothetical protein